MPKVKRALDVIDDDREHVHEHVNDHGSDNVNERDRVEVTAACRLPTALCRHS